MGLMSLSRRRRLVVLLELWSCMGGYLAWRHGIVHEIHDSVMRVRYNSMSIIAMLERTELLYTSLQQ
jgi:hypothetical protein